MFLFIQTNLYYWPMLTSEKAMATHCSTLVWKIPWTEEPGRLQSKGSLRVGYDWATSLSLFTFMHWRGRWQPTPVFLPGEFQGWGSLVGCHLWGRTESDTTEVTKQASNVNLKFHFENLLQFKVLILNEYHFYIKPNNNLNHYEHHLFMWTRVLSKNLLHSYKYWNKRCSLFTPQKI